MPSHDTFGSVKLKTSSTSDEQCILHIQKKNHSFFNLKASCLETVMATISKINPNLHFVAIRIKNSEGSVNQNLLVNYCTETIVSISGRQRVAFRIKQSEAPSNIWEPVSLTWFTNKFFLVAVWLYTTGHNVLLINAINFSFPYIYDNPDFQQVDSCFRFAVVDFISTLKLHFHFVQKMLLCFHSHSQLEIDLSPNGNIAR